MCFCGNNCCKECGKFNECGGCDAVNGHPFGGDCVAQQCVEVGGVTALENLKNNLIDDINSLKIEGLQVDKLHFLNGFFVNLEYCLPNNTKAKFLNDNDVYLGTQIQKQNSDKCYGVVGNQNFILVSEYGQNGEDPKLIIYKKR